MKSLSKQFPEYDDHTMVSFISDKASGLQGFISMHRSSKNIPAFGATRIVPYHNLEEALKDSLRLAKAMSYKSAMAGLRYGGGKGVIVAEAGMSMTDSIIKSYTSHLNMLGGYFITGADVGVSKKDVTKMKKHSPYIVGVKVDPVKYTAVGMVNALEICLNTVFNNSSVKDRSFAIQGVGKIGSAFLQRIYKQASQIYICDIDPITLKNVKKRFPTVKVVSPEAIYKQKVDVFSPCAMGNSLTSKTIAHIRAPIIMGGANDQLENPAVGELLYQLGILYAPDYVVNAGGLISVVDEYENKSVNSGRIKKRLNNIKVMLNAVIKKSSGQGKATNIVADQMAEKIYNSR